MAFEQRSNNDERCNDSLSCCGPASMNLVAQEMFQSQREAALRRRKQQFQSQSDLVPNTNGSSNKRLASQPRIRNFGQEHNCVETRSMHGMGHHHPFHETDHRSLPEGKHVGAVMYSRTMHPSSESHERLDRPVLDDTELKYRFPPGLESEPSSVTNTLFSAIPSTPEKYVYGSSSSDRIDEQTTISELTEYQNSDDRLKVGRMTRSPSTLAHMVSSEKRDTRRTLTTLESTSEGDPPPQRSTIDDDEEERRGEQNPSVEKMIEKANKYKEQINWDDAGQVKKFLMEPLPKEAGMIKCYIKRNKKQSRFFPEYRLYMQDDDIFLLSSKKRKKKKSSNYLISMSRNDHYKGSENVIGKLRSNFIGTEYQVYDNGKNPKAQDPFFDEKNEDLVRKELGIIMYGNNVTSTKGPRKMNVCISKVLDNGDPKNIWRPENDGDTMLKCFKQQTESALRDLYFYKNRQPKWNEDLSVYVLNFNSRVTMASVKNFQLIDKTNDEKEVIMQFGRTGNDEFIMDVQWPMSLFQAFAVSLSSCDSKLSE